MSLSEVIIMDKKHKHLSEKDRERIAILLELSKTATEIARELNKDRTCISKEVKKNRELVVAPRFKNGKTTMCASISDCPHPNTSICTKNCSSFELKTCKRLEKFPYVCNGCEKLKGRGCKVNTHKYYYVGSKAHKEYKALLSESRQGIRITRHDFNVIDDIIADSVMLRKNSVYHTVMSNKDLINVSNQTIYNYINLEYIRTRRVSQPRAAKFKTPKRRLLQPKLDSNWVKGRTYSDFREYMKESDENTIYLEMDTVVGKVNESCCMLTLIHPETSAFFAFKLEQKKPAYVRKQMYRFLRLMHDHLRTGYSTQIDIVILTDRGSEFYEPGRLEVHDDTGEVLCKVFYCDPMCSSQKPHIENVHTLVRRLIPKGTSLCVYSQQDYNNLMSQINSYIRKSLDGITPFEAFTNKFCATFLHRLKIKKLPHNVVSLKKFKK